MNEKARTYSLDLRTTSEVVLEKCPRLSEGDQVGRYSAGGRGKLSLQLGSKQAFSVKFTRHQDLS